jgi:prefoldin subunit 2
VAVTCSLVIETVKPLNDDRKCYRLINGVLVEREKKHLLPELEGQIKKVRLLTVDGRHFSVIDRSSCLKARCDEQIRSEIRNTDQIENRRTRRDQKLRKGSRSVSLSCAIIFNIKCLSNQPSDPPRPSAPR